MKKDIQISSLLLCILLKIVIIFWLFKNGYPLPTGDTLLFKQSAQMKLLDGYFYAPTYDQVRALATKPGFTFYPSFYIIFNYTIFSLFGFSYPISLIFDILIHLIDSLLLGYVIHQKSKNLLFSGIAILACTFLLYPIGRPEEIGVLFFLILLICFITNKNNLAFLFIGLSLATTPFSSLASVIIGIFILVRQENKAVFAFKVSPLLFLPYIVCNLFVNYPYIQEAFQKTLNATKSNTDFYKESFINLISNHVTSGSLFYLFTLSILLFYFKTNWKLLKKINFNTIIAITLFILLISTGFIFKRPIYDYRTIGYMTIILFFIQSFKVAKKQRFIISMLFITSIGVSSINLVKDLIIPFTWKEENTTYKEAEKILDSVIKEPDASIGGDGRIFMLTGINHKFYDLNINENRVKPDYYISLILPFSKDNKPRIFRNPRFKTEIETEYLNITPTYESPFTGSKIKIFGQEIKITPSNSDWKILIYQKSK